MNVKLSAHHFSGVCPLMVLECLARFTKEEIIQKMAEAQAFLTVPACLSGLAQSQLEVGVEMTGPEESSVTSFPEEVQYLLLKYATGPVIAAAMKDLRETHQVPTEDELTCKTRLNKALSWVGKVHPSEEIVSMFVDGLLHTVSRLGDDLYQSKSSATYLLIVHHSQKLGETQRAQIKETRYRTA